MLTLLPRLLTRRVNPAPSSPEELQSPRPCEVEAPLNKFQHRRWKRNMSRSQYPCLLCLSGDAQTLASFEPSGQHQGWQPPPPTDATYRSTEIAKVADIPEMQMSDVVALLFGSLLLAIALLSMSNEPQQVRRVRLRVVNAELIMLDQIAD